MKPNVRLFDGTLTLAQQAIILLWASVLLSVVGLWISGSFDLLTTGFSGTLLSVGRLLGLLATFFALTQFMLMGRILWIERAFGLDRLASFHRLNGYMAITFIVLHPIFIVSSYAVASGRNYVVEYINTLIEHPYAWLALIAETLFVTVVISSIYIARKHLKFETWYYVHLMVYVAIALVPFHQFIHSPELAGSEVGRTYWIGLYVFVALNLLVWRFGTLAYNYFKFDFRVSRVVHETKTTTSVYIKANTKNLAAMNVQPGQFIMVRILHRKFWWQEHPFTVSWIPRGDELRLTIRSVGDYTSDIAGLQPGARVIVAGPFGRFTKQVASTNKRLLIAGGVGITPIRSLAEEAASNNTDTTVLYSNRNKSDVPLKKELDAISRSNNVEVKYIYSDAEARPGLLTGRVNGVMIKQLVPDFKTRDIYVCGPPPMMAAIIEDLHTLGVPHNQIHFEQFALHN